MEGVDATRNEVWADVYVYVYAYVYVHVQDFVCVEGVEGVEGVDRTRMFRGGGGEGGGGGGRRRRRRRSRIGSYSMIL